jgi:hypothetical protein
MLRISRSAPPVPTTPRLRARWAPLWALGLAMVALLTLLLVGANLAGWMTTMGRGNATTVEQVDPTGSDPQEIKGWMTIQAVLDSYPVTKAALYKKFTIPADTPTSVELREVMENTPGSTLEIPALRTWLGEQGTQPSP